MTKAYIFVFYYISRNSSMSSLSSSVKTTFQQFSCVWRILICGISHDVSSACSSTDRATGLLLWVAFDCFVLLPVVRVLTSLARATFWVRFASLIFPIYNLFYLCHVIMIVTIIVKHYCPCSFLHNSSKSVSYAHNSSWDSSYNVLRFNLTLTPLPPSV